MTDISTPARRLGAVLATGALATGVALAAPAPALAAPQRVKIVQHNVEKRWPSVQTAMDQAVRVGAQGITLQEVCFTFRDQVRAAHPDWSVVWRASRAGGCGTGNDVGTMAVWTGGTTGVAQDPPLTKDPKRTPKLTCVKYGSSPVHHVCSAHLVSKDKGVNVRGKQTADIKRITGAWIDKGHAVVVGGDFNTSPNTSEMDSMYSLGGSGRFVEASQTATARAGKWTARNAKGVLRQIDYVFYSQNRTKVADLPGGTEYIQTGSDHRLLITRADVR